ncbi:MAG TPA: hypothetical protein VMM35_11095 [Longimicrobiales bacterium]|nr:hypothetical protein [Longimicrobiales bacterium]
MPSSLRFALAGLALTAAPLVAQLEQTGPTVQGFIFGDVLYSAMDGPGAEGFQLGQIVGHANAILSERVLFFGEVSLTYRSGSYAVNMERAILRYDFGDGLKVSAGRYHTPISFWNTAYHHGLWLQGSVARPEPVKFGTAFIPLHFVGAMVEGRLPGTAVDYMAGVGNGRSSNGVGAQDGGDANDNKAIILSASVQPLRLLGLRVGGGLYLDRVSDAGAGATDERIWSAHVVWERGSLDLVAEYIDVAHEPASGGGSIGSSAYYVHAGWRLSGAWRAFTPYARWEDMEVPVADPVFGGVVPHYQALVAGVRYDLDAPAALKAEYRREKIFSVDRDAFFLQVSFAIPFGGPA